MHEPTMAGQLCIWQRQEPPAAYSEMQQDQALWNLGRSSSPPQGRCQQDSLLVHLVADVPAGIRADLVAFCPVLPLVRHQD